jgi:hypothetical protein
MRAKNVRLRSARRGLSGSPGTVGAVQGMACVRSGQAPASPLSSDRSARRGSGVKRDFACTFTSHRPPVLVVLRPQSRLTLEGADMDTQRAIPESEPGRALLRGCCSSAQQR